MESESADATPKETIPMNDVDITLANTSLIIDQIKDLYSKEKTVKVFVIAESIYVIVQCS